MPTYWLKAYRSVAQAARARRKGDAAGTQCDRGTSVLELVTTVDGAYQLACAREGGGAMALVPWCYALVRLVGRLPVGIGALTE